MPMLCLSVKIVRWVDDSQPGWVECELLDASGLVHKFIDKVPIVTCDDLDSTNEFPQPGQIACTVLAQWRDEQGRALSRVTTDKPHGVESTEGLSEFVVLSDQLSPCAWENEGSV